LTDLVDENRIDWPAVRIEEIVDVEELKSREKMFEIEQGKRYKEIAKSQPAPFSLFTFRAQCYKSFH
jgi:hypothetical protein